VCVCVCGGIFQKGQIICHTAGSPPGGTGTHHYSYFSSHIIPGFHFLLPVFSHSLSLSPRFPSSFVLLYLSKYPLCAKKRVSFDSSLLSQHAIITGAVCKFCLLEQFNILEWIRCNFSSIFNLIIVHSDATITIFHGWFNFFFLQRLPFTFFFNHIFCSLFALTGQNELETNKKILYTKHWCTYTHSFNRYYENAFFLRQSLQRYMHINLNTQLNIYICQASLTVCLLCLVQHFLCVRRLQHVSSLACVNVLFTDFIIFLHK